MPDPQAHWTVLNLAGYRGVYNSAYVGSATALTGALWLSLGGFYVVRNSIGRDHSTGVGQVLAATSLRTPAYLVAKFASNVMVLASMAGVLAATALVLQLARGESRAVDPVALLLPFLVLTLPALTVTAAAALLLETIPRLRGGAGNVLWFVLALTIAIGGQSASAPLGGLGVHPVFTSLRAALADQGAVVEPGAEFSLGLTYQDSPLQTIEWEGFNPSAGFLLNRILLMVFALGVALLPALWFARFDPARRRAQTSAVQVPVSPGTVAESITDATNPRNTEGIRPPAPFTGKDRRATSGAAFSRLVRGELRILVQGISRWWWLVTVSLGIAGATVPTEALPGMLLAIWVWPVLIWSRLGTQRVEHDLEGLLRAYPRARRRVLAEWAAGLVLTALVAAGPGVRMALDADTPGVSAWLAGALFIPSLALVLGLVSRSHRLFQGLYLPLWYFVANGVAAVDYMGAVRVNGRPDGPPAVVIAGLALAMVLVALAVDAARDRGTGRPARSPFKPRSSVPDSKSLSGSQPLSDGEPPSDREESDARS